MLGWVVVEWVRRGRPTSIGTASGIVAGLVGITPACAFVSPLGALVIGTYLLIFERHQPFSVLFNTFDIRIDGSYWPAFLTASLAGMFLYLVSDLGASANGASFSIDGGWTAA